MISDSRRSAPVINSRLPKDRAGREYFSDSRELEISDSPAAVNVTLDFFI
jgi:hypothetical protein